MTFGVAIFKLDFWELLKQQFANFNNLDGFKHFLGLN